MAIRSSTRISRQRLQQLRNPEQQVAHAAVARAIGRGIMRPVTELACARCGSPAASYHHWKGYAPEHRLDVQPLCDPCHGLMHRRPQQSLAPKPRPIPPPTDGAMEGDEMLLIDAAALRNIPRRTAYHAAEEGRLKARQLGGRVWVVTLRDLDAWHDDPASHKRGPKPGGGTARLSKQRAATVQEG